MMSLPKPMCVTVPLNLARSLGNIAVNPNDLQLSQSEVNKEKSRFISLNRNLLHNFGNSKEGLRFRIVKKKQNVFKNKSDAHAFREKARLKRELLEKELLNLKIDKMRLLWENDQLKLRQSTLEEENLSLKRRLENPENCCHCKDEVSSEATLKHASFVNFPQPKDRVLLQIFLLLMAMIREIFNNLQMKPCITSHATNICLILNKCVKSVAPHMTAMMQTMCLSVP